MRSIVASILLIFAIAAELPAASSEDAYPMRWRIFRDYDSGTAFRFPYGYRIPDQYRGDLVRPGEGHGGGEGVMITVKGDIDPAKLAELVRSMRSEGLDKAAVRHRWSAVGDLPGGVDPRDHRAILVHLAERDFDQVEPFDYYGDLEARPHVEEGWAPEGVTCLRATAADACAQLIVVDDRCAALVLRGAIGDGDNRAILDSFEVLGEMKRGMVGTWREYKSMKDKEVFAYTGQPVAAKGSDPVDWAQAWECETPNYHITCSASPATTLQVGFLMEALHGAFSGVFDPESVPPYKMEIHILPTVKEFARMANTKGFGPVSDGRGGSLTGGFFVPSQLCIYSFEAPVPGYPTRMDRVLAHEASHQFLHVTCNGSRHVPTWINEGLAVYFESGEFKRGAFNWKAPVERLGMLRQQYGMGENTLMPLGDYLAHYGHIPASAYAEVYAMTHFWIFGAKGGKERFRDYWHALKAGEDGSEAFERIFMTDMIKAQGSRRAAVDAWQKMLVQYVLKGAPERGPKR